VLYSTDVATLFLDTKLKIRFFTPATKSLFNVIPGDIGRPLADLHSLAADGRLLEDANAVLNHHGPIEREIESHGGTCYIRRILPYRTQTDSVEGVVVTFVDVTDRRHIAKALETAKQHAELANAAKSRFLAAASHDLRQPLQTLSLLQGFLTKSVQGEKAANQIKQLGDALSAMAGILNTLLDINQIEAGMVHANPIAFPINDLLLRLRDEFAYQAVAQGLSLHAVPSGLSVVSDPHLLEQILRNLLANALKYTKKGRVLLGCRRRAGIVSIEIWDTGIGVADGELLAIFDEYHQIDNAARERSRGLGLGLSIVRRLANLLGHHVTVHSRPGKGSVFAVEVKRPAAATGPPAEPRGKPSEEGPRARLRTGTLLVVDDDPDLRELLEGFLNEQGHRTASAHDGQAALDLVERQGIRPDVLLVDFNLPNGMTGLKLAAQLRDRLHRPIPVIILTGDISNATAHDILAQDCQVLIKPVKLDDLTASMQRLLQPPALAAEPSAKPGAAASEEPSEDIKVPAIFIVDDDSDVRGAIRLFLEGEGHLVKDFPSCESFLAAYSPGQEGCLLLDAYLPGMKGLELLRRLKEHEYTMPAIMITGRSDVPMAVQAMKSGAIDFLEKPFDHVDLLACIERALEQSRDKTKLAAWRDDAASRVAGLTPRQRQIMGLILSGIPNKNIAADLGISQRTVEHHRASIMEKTASKSLPALARLAVAAAQVETF
jgi:two-component system CheB/CheR fusion protein